MSVRTRRGKKDRRRSALDDATSAALLAINAADPYVIALYLDLCVIVFLKGFFTK